MEVLVLLNLLLFFIGISVLGYAKGKEYILHLRARINAKHAEVTSHLVDILEKQNKNPDEDYSVAFEKATERSQELLDMCLELISYTKSYSGVFQFFLEYRWEPQKNYLDQVHWIDAKNFDKQQLDGNFYSNKGKE